MTAADDALGTKVGSQSIGLYDSDHVRGFSPRAAGNVRIEGLYFDQQTYGTNHCVVAEETVRVGLCCHARSNMDIDLARRSHGTNAGVVMKWRPTAHMELISFWGQDSGDEHDVLPTVYVNGLDRPPEFNQLRLPTRRWATWTWHELTAGAIRWSSTTCSTRCAPIAR